MLYFIRSLLMLILLCFMTPIVLILCLFRPASHKNIYWVSRLVYATRKIMGIEVLVERNEKVSEIDEPTLYLANHQSNYDMITLIGILRKNTVSVGKRSILFIPLFGLIYWITGNILINRKKSKQAVNILEQTAQEMKSKKMSIMLFPEGTRSKGAGLLPFKSGAFYLAKNNNFPIVLCACSNYFGKLDFNKWHSGKVLLKELDPILPSSYQHLSVHELKSHCANQLAQGIADLDLQLEATKHIKN